MSRFRRFFGYLSWTNNTKTKETAIQFLLSSFSCSRLSPTYVQDTHMAFEWVAYPSVLRRCIP
ncbi:Catalase [Frankliniella fusca]|uniref:Catalase n=1 Tax=Frankliniella fusca TaxID=407009 RepID=A0AAE1HMR0_9NEOP|nr:Catalase [Frankliniella fusca]